MFAQQGQQRHWARDLDTFLAELGEELHSSGKLDSRLIKRRLQRSTTDNSVQQSGGNIQQAFTNAWQAENSPHTNKSRQEALSLGSNSLSRCPNTKQETQHATRTWQPRGALSLIRGSPSARGRCRRRRRCRAS